MTSTTANFKLTFDDILDQAFAMAVGGEAMTGDDARRSRQLMQTMFAVWCNKGAALWSVYDATATLSAGQGQFACDPDTIDIADLRIDYGDGILVPLERNARAEFKAIPDPLFQSRPSVCWVDRKVDNILVNLWPLADSSGPYTIHFTKWQRLRDVSSFGDTVDLPERFYDAAISGLAWYIARGRPLPQDLTRDQVDAIFRRIQYLKGNYDETFDAANKKGDDGGPVMMEVESSHYCG